MLNKIKTFFQDKYFEINKLYYLKRKAAWQKKYLPIKKKYTIISLGWNCLSRAIPTQWGLKPNKEQGEKSCPFDLSMHNIKGIIYNLDTGFKDYYETLRKESNNWWYNDLFKIIYNHDDTITSTEEFKERYNNRIANFKEALSFSNEIIFIYNTKDNLSDTIEDLHNLNTVLNKLKNGKYKLFILAADKKYLDFKEKNCFVCYSPLPNANYVWYKEKDRFSFFGLRYEKRIIKQLYEYIQR